MALCALLLGLLSLWLYSGMGPIGLINGGLLANSDYPYSAAAFRFYEIDGWHWPLGRSPAFGDTNLFFSDGVPWFAMLAKTVHILSGISLPFETVIVLNFVLLALFAGRLIARCSDDPYVVLAGMSLFVLNPVMPTRIIGAQHIALSSYYVLLFSMTCVADDPKTLRQRVEPVIATTLSVMTHMYLGAMSVVLVIIPLLARRRYFTALACAAAPTVALWAYGAFAGGYTLLDGAERYGMDLAAIFNSLNWGVVGELYRPAYPEQGDCLLYLGTGTLLLAGLCLASRAVKRRSAAPMPVRALPTSVWLASVLLMLYALAFQLIVAGHFLIHLEIPGILHPLYGRFRAPGRFATPWVYALLAATVLCWAALKPRMGKWWWLATFSALCLQSADAIVSSRSAAHLAEAADVQTQREAVARLLDHRPWSGRVFEKVPVADLGEQRLIDYLLVQHGAKAFAVTPSGRLDVDAVNRRMGYDRVQQGDLIIASEPLQARTCRYTMEALGYYWCLV
jgi:hypothetical protein